LPVTNRVIAKSLLGSSSFMFLLFDDIQLADVSLFVLTGIPQIIPFSR
jgi:hypothetical protein